MSISFCVGYQCPLSKKIKIVRFYQEMQEIVVKDNKDDVFKTVMTPNFRPYFPTRDQV